MTDTGNGRRSSAAITVCDAGGIILQMNDRAPAVTNAAGAGSRRSARNVLDCHPERVKAQLAEMLASGRRTSYTIEKRGVKKLIPVATVQAGTYAGFVELSLEIPFELAAPCAGDEAGRALRSWRAVRGLVDRRTGVRRHRLRWASGSAQPRPTTRRFTPEFD